MENNWTARIDRLIRGQNNIMILFLSLVFGSFENELLHDLRVCMRASMRA